MKVKILSSYPKQTYHFDNVYYSSDLHLNHQSVISFGRKFNNVEEMNSHIITEINKQVWENDLLVLLGDTLMGEKDYLGFINSLVCKNIIILLGNHCSRSKLLAVFNESDKILYIGDYLELNIEKQIVCCSHFPMFNWNYQDDGAICLHGHLHGDTNEVINAMREYKTMDVGIDAYYNLFGKYSIFSHQQILDLLKDKKVLNRH